VALDSQDSLREITFHFVNGQTESFNIVRGDGSMTAQDLQQKIMRILDKTWFILHLPQQTICINTANILKVELKPPVHELRGEGVFSDARRVTALARSVQH
jgi:hypothetical protein